MRGDLWEWLGEARMGRETGEQEHRAGRKGWGSRTQGEGQEESDREGMTQRQWDRGGHPACGLLSLLIDMALVLAEPSPAHHRSQHSTLSVEAKTVCHPSSREAGRQEEEMAVARPAGKLTLAWDIGPWVAVAGQA